MDAGNVLQAIDEQSKWQRRKKMLLEKLEALHERKKLILRELEEARKHVAHFDSIITSFKETKSVPTTDVIRIESMR